MKTLALLCSLLVATACATAAAAREPLKVVMFSGSKEYGSDESLKAFKALLEEKHDCKVVVHAVPEKGTQLTGVEDLDAADVAVFFTRRVSLADDQLAKVKRFVASGKGVVGVRTASHGFQTWLEFDGEVLGGQYKGHYQKDEPAEVVAVDEKAKAHPVLAGVDAFETRHKLYKNPKLADDVTVLLRAKAAAHAEPVAWARDAEAGARGRVFYTSMGGQNDFTTAPFLRMLANAVVWSAGDRQAEKR